MADGDGPREGELALLDGEGGEWSAADAKHWAEVYRELIRFCRQALGEDRSPDGDGLRRRLEQFEKRLAFWKSGPITKG
jgi:hypothetical protein